MRESHTQTHTHTHLAHTPATENEKKGLLVPQNGRWSNSNSQKSHRDLVQWKSIMAPSKGNDFFCPSSWFSTMKRNKIRTCTRTRGHICTHSANEALAEHQKVMCRSAPPSPLYRSFIPSDTGWRQTSFFFTRSWMPRYCMVVSRFLRHQGLNENAVMK